MIAQMDSSCSQKPCFVWPKTIEEALKAKAEWGSAAVILAGGTDVMTLVHSQALRPECLLYIGGLGLDYIEPMEDNLVIGACATLSELEQNPLVQEYCPLLATAIKEVAGVSIRNIATIGGNLCNASPAADTATPLMVLDAYVRIVSSNSERLIPIDGFFLGPKRTCLEPDEIVTEIIVPRQKGKAVFHKIGKRKAETISVINAAVYCEEQDNVVTAARIALGAVAPTPVRCYGAEDYLENKPVSAEVLKQAAILAAEYASPIDDIRATAWYRKSVAPGLVERSLCQIFGEKEAE